MQWCLKGITEQRRALWPCSPLRGEPACIARNYPVKRAVMYAFDSLNADQKKKKKGTHKLMTFLAKLRL